MSLIEKTRHELDKRGKRRENSLILVRRLISILMVFSNLYTYNSTPVLDNSKLKSEHRLRIIEPTPMCSMFAVDGMYKWILHI